MEGGKKLSRGRTAASLQAASDEDRSIDNCILQDPEVEPGIRRQAVIKFNALKKAWNGLVQRIQSSSELKQKYEGVAGCRRQSVAAELLPKLERAAKAKVGETYGLVSREGIQMHGGIGMTDEFEIGFFIKRAAVAEQTFGDVNYHRNRYGELEGY